MLVFDVVVALLVLASATTAHCKSITGIYALDSGIRRPIPQAVLENPNVDGIALRYSWEQLEPRDGTFAWSDVDHDLAEARHYHKGVSLSVTAGVQTPKWVYDAGAARFTFPWDRPWGYPPCSRQSIPIPWDATYLSRWKTFVRELGSRYADNPSVIGVKLTGINGPTQETQLPHFGDSQMTRNPATCGNADTVSAWLGAGYTRTKVHAAWRSIGDTFANSFPGQQLVLMIGPGAFPPIDDSGTIMLHRKADPKLVHALIDDGIERYGVRFVVQNNGLSAVRCWYELSAVARRVIIGYQMLWEVTNDLHCRMNGGVRPCNPQIVLQSSFERGMECGTHYFEVYLPDIQNPALANTIAEARQRLITQSSTR